MISNLIRLALWAAVTAVSAALLLVVAYFVKGSLELFPTDEQRGKVRVVTGCLAAILIAIEIGLWALLRRRGPRRPPGELGNTVPPRVPHN